MYAHMIQRILHSCQDNNTVVQRSKIRNYVPPVLRLYIIDVVIYIAFCSIEAKRVTSGVEFDRQKNELPPTCVQ